MRTITIARNTFRESVRDKVLYVLLFFAAVVIFGSKALGWITIGQDIKVIKDVSLAAVLVFGVLIAIFAGANLVYKEIDKRTLYTILARPVRRYEFIVGKYLGLCFLLALIVILTGLMTGGYIALLGGQVNAVFLYSLFLIFCELMVVTAFSVLLSTVTSPILGALIVFSVFMLGHATGVLIDLPPQFDGTSAKHALEILYYTVPNLDNFNIRAEAANGVAVSPLYVGWTVLYGVAYIALFLVLASLVFEEKDV